MSNAETQILFANPDNNGIRPMRNDRTLVLKKNRTALRLPWFRDPRRLSRRDLLAEVLKYGGDPTSLNDLPKAELVAAVFELLVEYGKKNPINPSELEDEQPEKWYILAEQLHREIVAEEPNPSQRVHHMAAVRKVVRGLPIATLIDIANGESPILRNEPDAVRRLFYRFVAALILEPHFEQLAESKTGHKGLIRSSVTITGNYNGFTGVPAHLSVYAARRQSAEAEQQRAKPARKRSLKLTLEFEGRVEEEEVVVGEEISVQLSRDKCVRARVNGITGDAALNPHVTALPIHIQDLGPHFEFSLTLPELRTARSNALPDKTACLDF